MGDLAMLETPRWTVRDHPGLFEALRTEAINELQALLTRSLDKVDIWLGECLSKAPSFTPMREAARTLRGRRGEFERAYLSQLQQGFAVLHGRILPEPSATVELSLMDDEALAGMLASESMVVALQNAHSLDLDVLARRLAVMAGRPSLRDAHNPMSAVRLATALQGAQQACPMPDAMRGPLFKTYERELIASLGGLLESLSARLSQAGILPNLDCRPAPMPEQEVEEGPPLPAVQVYVPESAPGIDVRETFNVLRRLLQRRRPTPAPAATATTTSGDVALPDLTRPLDDSEIVAVMSLMQPTLQASVLTALSDSGATLAELIKEEVLQSVGNVGRTRDTASLSQDQEDAIDLVGMLFGVLFEEREFVERPRQLLAQLVVPYVKAAVMDLRMFQFTTHPARLLLNALAESLEGNRAEGVHERALQKQVESVIQRLLAGFKLSISIFPKLESEFREYLVRHRQRVEVAERRAAELQRGQERLEHARSRAANALHARLDGRALPASIRDFMTRFWTHHLAMVLLREGAESQRWQSALMTGDRLLALHALGPASIRSRSTLTELDGELQGVLQSSGVTGDAAKEILAGVLAALVRPVDLPKTTTGTAAVQAPAMPTVTDVAAVTSVADAGVPDVSVANPVAADSILPDLTSSALQLPAVRRAPTAPASIRQVTNTTSFLDEDLELAAIRALKLGDWIELIGDDGKTRPVKLSWVSPISGNMVFVNRHGARILVASSQELVTLRRKGGLLLHAHVQLFDHALRRIQDRLEAQMSAA